MIKTRNPPEQIQVSRLSFAWARRTGHMTSVSIHAAFTDSTDISFPVNSMLQPLFKAVDHSSVV